MTIQPCWAGVNGCSGVICVEFCLYDAKAVHVASHGAGDHPARIVSNSTTATTPFDAQTPQRRMARRSGDLLSEAIEYGLRYNADSVVGARSSTRAKMIWSPPLASPSSTKDKASEQQTTSIRRTSAAVENIQDEAMARAKHAKALGSHPMRAEDFELLQDHRRPSHPISRRDENNRIGGTGSAATIYAPRRSNIPADNHEGRKDPSGRALRQAQAAVALEGASDPTSKWKQCMEKARNLGSRDS